MANIELLRQGTLFGELDDDQLAKFAGISETREYCAGDIIIAEGAEGDSLYIVEEGKVTVTKSENEVKSTLGTLEEGEQFGEMSLLESAPTSAQVAADGKVLLLVIQREKFIRLLDEETLIAAKVYKAMALSLSKRLRATSADLITWKPEFDF